MSVPSWGRGAQGLGMDGYPPYRGNALDTPLDTLYTPPLLPLGGLHGIGSFPGYRGRGIGVQGNRCRALHPRDPYPHYPLSPLYARTCTPGIYGGTSRGYRCWGRGCTVKRSIPLLPGTRVPPSQSPYRHVSPLGGSRGGYRHGKGVSPGGAAKA